MVTDAWCSRKVDIAIRQMTDEIADILGDNLAAVYLYGSYTLGDFRPGWSDLDILVLTEAEIPEEQAERLVGLRQEMSGESGDALYCCFEGGMLSLNSFVNGLSERAVYWGTSGQRIADSYALDAFCRKELIENGHLLRGRDVRNLIAMPDCSEIAENVRRHCESIRKYSHLSGKSIYSFGWILDIARGIYTLQTGKIISKTEAGEWALKEKIFPDDSALKTALEIRKNPRKFYCSAGLRESAEKLNPAIQRYVDVLESELGKNRCEMRRED